MAIDLSALSSREALSAVYIGYYDRAADVAGMQFWEQVVANTSLDLVAITSDFASQSETQEVHPFFADPATSSPATFITSLYQNLFHRDPDEAGLTFWSDALQDAIDGVEGAISVGQIITSIIEGAQSLSDGGFPDEEIMERDVYIQQEMSSVHTIFPMVRFGQPDVVLGHNYGTVRAMRVQPLYIRRSSFVSYGEINTKI